MPAPLFVRHATRSVGTLEFDGARFQFVYAEAWLAGGGFPISVCLPLRSKPYATEDAHHFFANLLPEGSAREAVCRRLGISASNDYALLAAIGGECAGALAITLEDCSPDPDRYRYEDLPDTRLVQLLESEDRAPLLLGGPRTRLSLAGAQDKLPVAVLEGRLHLPLDGAPSTHILKLPSSRYRHLPANEAFVMGLAARIGLDVAACELLVRFDPAMLLVTRYDRVTSDDARPVIRLHQEDHCQALGLPPSRKYEQEGGPRLATVIEVLRSHVRRPLVDVARVIEWQAFNVIVGNADGHGKNLSLVHDPDGIHLAPFYDLVSTRQYRGIDRRLAMSVGGRRDMAQLHAAQWAELAAEAGMGARAVTRLVAGVAERCLDTLGSWRTEFEQRHGAQPILQTLPRWIDAQARRVFRSLAGG
jgi:serine/threonine-protein kinase HipA